MTKILDTFKKRKVIIPYITAGDPSLKETEELVLQLEEAGADIIEIGVPFSDPLADGLVIQASHARALEKDTTLSDVFELVKNIRKKSQIPIVFMLACNLIEQYGYDKFYIDCEKVGVDGVLVPDMPLEEFANVQCLMSNVHCLKKVDQIFMVAPTTKNERIKKIAKATSGFIYLVSSLGITGKRKNISSNISALTTKIRKYTKTPIAVGFGISTPSQAKEVARFADGVIIGSALVEMIGAGKTKEAISFIKNVRRELNA